MIKPFLSFLTLFLFAFPASAADLSPQAYGAIPSDNLDDSIGLQAALDALQPGDRLVLESGVYHHGNQLFLSNKTDVEIVGLQGSVLLSTDPSKSALTVQDSESVSLRGLNVQGSGVVRLSQDKTCGILVYRTSGLTIRSSRIAKVAGAGIMLQQTDNFTIQGNLVTDTLADAIHITNRSHNGIVIFNTTLNAGDDGVALVGYVKNGGRVHDVEIENNHVLGNTHGRGVTVEGAYTVSVSGNYIQNTASAGIILISSASYNTYGVRDVVVTGNTLVGTNWELATVQGAMLLSARDGSAQEDGLDIPFTISQVRVEGNTFIDTVGAQAHLRVSNYSVAVQVLGNEFVDADSSHLPWTFYRGAQVTESGNTYNSAKLD